MYSENAIDFEWCIFSVVSLVQLTENFDFIKNIIFNQLGMHVEKICVKTIALDAFGENVLCFRLIRISSYLQIPVFLCVPLPTNEPRWHVLKKKTCHFWVLMLDFSWPLFWRMVQEVRCEYITSCQYTYSLKFITSNALLWNAWTIQHYNTTELEILTVILSKSITTFEKGMMQSFMHLLRTKQTFQSCLRFIHLKGSCIKKCVICTSI